MIVVSAGRDWSQNRVSTFFPLYTSLLQAYKSIYPFFFLPIPISLKQFWNPANPLRFHSRRLTMHPRPASSSGSKTNVSKALNDYVSIVRYESVHVA